MRIVCSIVLNDTYGLRPLTKEALLFVIHYESGNSWRWGGGVTCRAVSNIVADTISQFKKDHVKRLYRLKAEFEEDDWELINTNTKYVSYFLSCVCL